MSQYFASVVIPAYNCEKTIANTIQAVLDQSYPPIKIIVVDDGSVDNTPAVIKSFSTVIYLRQENAGPAKARTRGAKEADSDIVFFTDSDCVPQKDWLQQSIKHFEDPNVGAVAGSYGIANRESLLATCIHQEIIYRHQKLLPKDVKVFGSYNVGIRKNLFDQLGGFDETYRFASGEDNDLSYKILKAGYKIRFEINSRVDHFHTTRVLKYLKEQYRHGFWRVKMYFEHPKMMAGDNYTFWKDALEVPLVVFMVFFAVLGLAGIDFCKQLFVINLNVMMILELFFSFFMTKTLFKTIFFALVMFYRAFARTLGFSAGFLYFLPKKIFRNSN